MGAEMGDLDDKSALFSTFTLADGLAAPQKMGKPVIAGTRITVELVLEKLAAGESLVANAETGP
jgi:hypothetical protein